MRLFSGHYCFFHYKVTQKTGVRSKFVPQYNLKVQFEAIPTQPFTRVKFFPNFFYKYG